MYFDSNDISELDKQKRTNLINCLSGIKALNLIGTKSNDGLENLAIFNSVVHIGAHPPLMGFIHRPVSVERHTYENILANKYFTINSVQEEFIDKAHQTSARYERVDSEFEKVGLTPFYAKDFFAPFVKESKIQIGLKLADIIPLQINNTVMIIGEVVHLEVKDEMLTNTYDLDLALANVAGGIGLSSYVKVNKLASFQYAKPDKELKEIQ